MDRDAVAQSTQVYVTGVSLSTAKKGVSCPPTPWGRRRAADCLVRTVGMANARSRSRRRAYVFVASKAENQVADSA